MQFALETPDAKSAPKPYIPVQDDFIVRRSTVKTLYKAAIAACAFVSMAGAQTQALPEPAPSNSLLACEQQQGFQLLFSGTLTSFQNNFATWKGNNTTNTDIDSRWTFSAPDSSISTTGTSSDIRSRAMYGDFDWRLTYKNNGNEGIFYKALARGCCEWSTAVEFAIDDGVPSTKQQAGAPYDIFVPSPIVYQKYATGKWNTVRIVAKGDSVEHWMNNTKIAGFKYWNARWNTALAASKWNGAAEFAQQTDGCKCMINPGWIGFQGDHGGAWLIKNMRINSNATTVNVGPAQCPTPVEGAALTSPSYAVERLAGGGLRFSLRDGKIRKAEILDVNGKSVAQSLLESGGKSAVVKGWRSPGVYIFRIATQSGKFTPLRIFLP